MFTRLAVAVLCLVPSFLVASDTATIRKKQEAWAADLEKLPEKEQKLVIAVGSKILNDGFARFTADEFRAFRRNYKLFDTHPTRSEDIKDRMIEHLESNPTKEFYSSLGLENRPDIRELKVKLFLEFTTNKDALTAVAIAKRVQKLRGFDKLDATSKQFVSNHKDVFQPPPPAAVAPKPVFSIPGPLKKDFDLLPEADQQNVMSTGRKLIEGRTLRSLNSEEWKAFHKHANYFGILLTQARIIEYSDNHLPREEFFENLGQHKRQDLNQLKLRFFFEFPDALTKLEAISVAKRVKELGGFGGLNDDEKEFVRKHKDIFIPTELKGGQ